jgi:hypothetical protein
VSGRGEKFVACPEWLLDLLIEACIIDRDGGLCHDADSETFGAIGEDTRPLVTEEQTAQNHARAGHHWNRQITPDGKMARRHAAIGFARTVARILANVVGADDPLTAECRTEYGCIAGHRKARERFVAGDPFRGLGLSARTFACHG